MMPSIGPWSWDLPWNNKIMNLIAQALFYMLYSFNPIITLLGKYCYSPYLKDKKTKT